MKHSCECLIYYILTCDNTVDTVLELWVSFYLFILFATKEAHELREVVKRLKKLEDTQKATVDSCIDEIRHIVKSPMFTKNRALDYLLNLKIVAKEATNSRSGFFLGSSSCHEGENWSD